MRGTLALPPGVVANAWMNEIPLLGVPPPKHCTCPEAGLQIWLRVRFGGIGVVLRFATMITPKSVLPLRSTGAMKSLDHSESPFTIDWGSRFDLPRIVPSTSGLPSSSTISTRTSSGSSSGTPRGFIPFELWISVTSTRARVLRSGKNGSHPQRSGASSSVALTSRNFVSQGIPAVQSSVLPSDGSPLAQKVLLFSTAWTSVVPSSISGLCANGSLEGLRSPAYASACNAIASLAASGFWKQPVKAGPPASAAASTCVWRCRLSTYQFPTSITSDPITMSTGMKNATRTRTWPRSCSLCRRTPPIMRMPGPVRR